MDYKRLRPPPSPSAHTSFNLRQTQQPLSAQQAYRRMRDTWELLVEELMFAGAVKRFRRSIETKKLRMVSVEDDDVAAVFAGMTRCSYFTHEGGAEAPPPLPEPDAFMADIENLGQAVATIIARNKEVERRREAAGISA